MDKVNRIQTTQILVFVTCSIFIMTPSIPTGTLLSAQPEDDWVAHPMYISPFAGTPTPQGYSPAQIRTAYNLPSSGGAGTTIAIIDAFDTPNILNYFNEFSSQYGLPDNGTGNFLVHKMAQNIGTDSDWALETCLDVEWAHAIAPNAKILLVEAVSNSRNNLLSAVDYATSQPGVVAVSMSWGDEEFSSETSSSFENHFNKPGITFFASSGDDGTNVIWPAVSANVVSVGGTTLNLKPDGTVISEIAWRNSSGGVSDYVAKPSFQTNFGVTYANRTVPDVSYNGDPSTGVSVYNGTWLIIGGTSAGAPQWAAIHALGLSATNTNLYARAKSAYSSYFSDIISGSNYANPAAAGYDLVTGLGSPLTTNFGTAIAVSPTSGPPGASITLNGVGFVGNSADISYFNPISSSWIPLINNLAIVTGNFSYSFNAPDLQKNNPAGDNQPFVDNIVFRARDNSNGRSYDTTVPYSEGRRGIIQIGNAIAQGLYGNNTNLATSVFVQNGDTVPFSGQWFSPGSLSLLWDNITNLGAISTDNIGFFNTTVIMPTATAGQHTLTLKDGTVNFCLNLTSIPTLSNDYLDGWHTSNFTINLTPDYAVYEIFYRINDSPILTITSNGQPAITTEGNNNKLEYWSTWDLYGTGIVELPHVTLTGIKLDKTTALSGSITPSSVNVNTPVITLSLSATDDVSGIAQMRFSNENSDWSTWEPYTTSKTWTLSSGDGTKTVNVQYMDTAGLTSTYSTIVNLTTPAPSSSPTISPTIKPAASANPTSKLTPIPTPSSSPTISPTVQPSATTQIPELNIEMVLVLLAASTPVLALIFKRSRKQTKAP